MKNIFLDADILLDVALERQPFALHASLILSLPEYVKTTSVLNIANLYYLVSKHQDKYQARNNVGLIISHCQILSVDSSMIRKAHNSLFKTFSDFEDAIQHYCAVGHSMNAIITRNGKDFRNSELPVYSPKKFLELFNE